RIQAMVDAVWRQVDRPNYYNRAVRRMEHWYTRNNKTEKVAAVFGTVTDIGSIFLPFMKGATVLNEIARSAVSTTTSATNALVNIVGMGQLKAEGRYPTSSKLLNRTLIEEKAKSDIRGSGATIQAVM